MNKREWAQMLDRLACDPALSSTRHRVLAVILRHVGSKDHDLTQQTIANETGMSLATVKRSVAWLVANGYLASEKRATARGYRAANEYAPGPVSLGIPAVFFVPPGATKVSSLGATKVSPVTQQKRERTTTRTTTKEEDFLGHLTSLEQPPTPLACPVEGVQSQQDQPPPSAERVHHVLPPTPSTHRMSAIETVLDRLDRVQRNGTSTLASCPVSSHGKGGGDRNPSLSVTERDGKVLLNCMTGCHVQDVMAALGLDWPDLFDEPITNERGVKVAEWIYQKPDGSPHLIVERWQKPMGKAFVQRLPDGTAKLPKDYPSALYQLPQVIAAAQAGEEIFIVEGEKSVAAAARLGVVATTAPGGANKHWQGYYAKWLEGASRITVVTDNDEVGMRYAAEVSAALKMRNFKVRVVKAAVADSKADLWDHVMAGKGLDELIPVRLNRLHPETTNLSTLLTGDFPELKWVVPGLIPVGLTLLGGAQKTGKSYLATHVALGVAHGMDALYGPKCNQGSVLYLSLDNDDENEMSRRVRHLTERSGYPRTGPFEYRNEYPSGDDGVAAIRDWVEFERENERTPLLVVCDTLARIEPNFEGTLNDKSLYGGTTRVMAKWARLADEAEIGLLMLHHSRKQYDPDWQNRFTGSNAITASAKTMLMIDTKRGEESGILHQGGRSVEGGDFTLKRDGWGWCLVDDIQREYLSPRAGLHLVPN